MEICATWFYKSVHPVLQISSPSVSKLHVVETRLRHRSKSLKERPGSTDDTRIRTWAPEGTWFLVTRIRPLCHVICARLLPSCPPGLELQHLIFNFSTVNFQFFNSIKVIAVLGTKTPVYSIMLPSIDLLQQRSKTYWLVWVFTHTHQTSFHALRKCYGLNVSSRATVMFRNCNYFSYTNTKRKRLWAPESCHMENQEWTLAFEIICWLTCYARVFMECLWQNKATRQVPITNFEFSFDTMRVMWRRRSRWNAH